MSDPLKKAATSILLAELLDDDEVVSKGVNSVVDMVTTLNAVAGATLALSERQREGRDPSSGCLRRVAPEFTTAEFRSLFRMRRSTFEMLLKELEEYATFPQKRFLSLEKKLLCTLWLLGNLETYRNVATRFNISKGTLHYAVIDVCHAIIELQKRYIKFPTKQAFTKVAESFSKSGYPGVVGCLGVCHIGIPGPSEYREAYVNGAGIPSIQLQAVADSNLQFIDIYTGWPGSVPETRVFRNSPIVKFLINGNLPSEFHLLGNSAYDLKTYCMVPYQDCNCLTQVEETYNKKHTSVHLCIKRTFSLLKGKFRRLKALDMRSLDAIPVVVAATCVLHNLILTVEGIDESDMDDGEESDDNINCESDTGVQNKESLAWEKRDTIAASL